MRLRVRNKIIHLLPWIPIFCHLWSDSAMIFTRDFVTRENHCRIASLVTKIVIQVMGSHLFGTKPLLPKPVMTYCPLDPLDPLKERTSMKYKSNKENVLENAVCILTAILFRYHCAVSLMLKDISFITWWRHQMESFSALLAHCAGNSPVTGEFPVQRTMTGSFGVFFDMCLNNRLSKQSWGWWVVTPPRPLWRHCNEYTMFM